MILNRLKKALQRQDWFAVGLEVLIVVAGVLIAFMANDWAAARQDREIEIESLRELRQALLNDLGGIEQTGEEGHRRVANSVGIIQEHLASGRPYEDSLGAHFAWLGTSSVGTRDLTAYETLKQRGLGTVTNDSLRIAIGRLYGMTYETLVQFQEATHQRASHYVIPYLAPRFRDYAVFENATPVDYAALGASPEFQTILANSAFLHSELATLHEDVAAQIRALVTQIDEELERLD